jgi:ABC-2 type transport system ATP-binding protein
MTRTKVGAVRDRRHNVTRNPNADSVQGGPVTEAVTTHRIELQGVNVRGELEDFTLSVPLDGVTAILGAHGAGKTALLRTLIGLERPESGLVLVFGISPFEMGSVIRRRVGFMPQQIDVDVQMRVREWLLYYSGLGSARQSDDLKRADEALALFRLTELADQRAAKLPRGPTRRLAAACAFATGAPLLLLDAPVAHLDYLERALLFACLEAAAAKVSVVYTTDRIDDALAISRRVVVLSDGRVVSTHETAALRGSAEARAALESGS